MRIDEVREQGIEDLRKELADQERGLMNLRFRKATLQLADVSELRKARQTIARIRTVIRERQIAEAADAS